MRGSVAMQVGDQMVASSPAVGADASRSAARRGRRWLWAILSFLFLLGIVLSTVMMRSERNEAIATVAAGARVQAQRATSTLTGKQLRKPVTGSSYDRLAAKFRKYAPSDATIVGVTIWSSKGRILFSLNESLVGTTPPETRSSITSIAKGSGSTRVLDDTVQTFTPVSKAPGGPVAIVEVDHPLAVVEAQSGDGWSVLRLGSVVGLAVSLLLLVLTFVPSRRLRPAPSPGTPQGSDEAVGKGAGEPDPVEERPTEARTPTYEEIFGLHDESHSPEPEYHESRGDEVESDAHSLAEQPPAEEPPSTSQEDAPPLPADLDETVDQVRSDGDDDSSEPTQQVSEEFEGMADEDDPHTERLRQRREEFKARAEAAALRVKKPEAELQEASPTPD